MKSSAKSLKCVLLTLLALAVLAAPALAASRPAPIGLELGVATAEDITALGGEIAGMHLANGGVLYEFDAEKLAERGFTAGRAVLGHDGRLVAVRLEMPDGTFPVVERVITEKYSVSKRLNTEGVERVEATLGSDVIVATRMGSAVAVEYSTAEFAAAAAKRLAERYQR